MESCLQKKLILKLVWKKFLHFGVSHSEINEFVKKTKIPIFWIDTKDVQDIWKFNEGDTFKITLIVHNFQLNKLPIDT